MADHIVASVLFTIACVVRKAVSDGSWIGFNGSVFGVMAVGFRIWFSVRKKLLRE